MKFLKIKLLIMALVAVVFAASSAFASMTYDVTINTSEFTGTSGYLYLQYDPFEAASSTATVSSFYTDGTLGSQDTVDVVNGSAVTGALPGSVVFANTNSVNDYNNAITSFGTAINFDVTLGNLASGGRAGGSSTFSVGLYQDAYGSIPLVNTSGGALAGTALEITLNNNGTTSTQVLASEANVSPAPVPAAAWLLGSGLTGLVGIRRRMKG